MNIRKITLFAFLMLLTSSLAFGQAARNGTNAAPQLMIPLGAQYLSGGGAVATASGVEGIIWNPAGLDKGDMTAMALFSRREYLADIGVSFAGVGLRFGGLGGLAVTLRSFDIGEIPITTEFQMDGTGGTYQPTFFVLGATYSKQMADRIRAGFTLNVINESLGEVQANGVTFDAGVQYDNFLDLQGLNIGVSIRNIGTSMTYDGPGLYVEADDFVGDRGITTYKVEAAEADMPTVIDLGFSYSPIQNLNVGITYTENNYAANDYRFLGSYNLGDIATLRGAYLFSEDQGELENIFSGPQFGGSLYLAPLIGTNLSLDYAFIPVEYFDANHIYSIRLAF
ncbi:MAG: PorV/PorQ family protein [Candidatus Marinimicrobia bacterium]|nr:PorV/PorQ family protein [Candidatus Neomarinimicrobiota bacterium]